MLENNQAATGFALKLAELIKTLRIPARIIIIRFGVAYDMTGDHKTAQATVFRSKALQDSPKNAMLLQNNLALSYIFEGSYHDKAIARLLIRIDKKARTPSQNTARTWRSPMAMKGK